jgi:hypothetical protein
VATDRTLVEKLEALTPQQRAELRLPSFLGPVDVDQGVRLRHKEPGAHPAVHSDHLKIPLTGQISEFPRKADRSGGQTSSGTRNWETVSSYSATSQT